MKKFRIALFKLIDILVILTMVSASPMSIPAAAMAQDAGPVLVTDQPEYAAGESARITGSGFAAGEYVLAVEGANWASVTVDDSGVFVTDSPALDGAGTYEVRAYAAGWSGDWGESPVASASFTVSAPPEPTQAPTEEPTAEPTQAPTEELPATTEPTAEPTATNEPTVTPEPTTAPPPYIQSDKEDYFPGELVTLTSGNWQPDESVHIFVNDDAGQSWSHNADVAADASGEFTYQFYLPAWFVAMYSVTATGAISGMATTTFTDGTGAYNLDFSAADPGDSPTYTKVTPGQLACPTPSGGTGRAADPLAEAIFGNPVNSVESLAPEDMILGQIVPFETEIRVNGSVDPENGRIKIIQTFFTKTQNGGNFGYDPAYGLYCAFIDTADSGNSTLAAGTKVESFSYTILQPGTANERIQATIIVSGLVDPETAILETWVVLKSTIPAGTGSNVQSSIGPAQTCTNAGCTTGGNISVGNQTVPLLQVGTFFTTDADLSITKSDSPDPVVQGEQLTYTIQVTNNGPATANGITVTDTLDSNTSYVSSSVPCSGTTTLTCSVGNLDVGASTSFTITVLVSGTAPTTITPGIDPIGGTCTAGSQDLCNLVSVDAINNDPTAGNNTDSEPTNVLARGGITINKVALGGDATFGYTTSGAGLSSFNLTTINGSGTQSFTNLTPGAKTVTESAPPAGWDFTSLSCSDPDNGTTTSGATANIDLDPGESITCTYTNTKRGTIIVEKQTDPADAADSFTFTGDAAGTIADNGQLSGLNLVPGTYTATEADPAPTWGLTSISCDDGASATPSTFDLGARTATFHLDPGETVKCTFTNTLQQGTLTVIKQVVTDNGGTATAANWSIHVTSGGTDVTDSPQPGSETGTLYTLIGGTYNVSESNGPSGYTFTGFSGDCDANGDVIVVPGENKTCTLTNDDQPGTLIVKKVVINDNGGTKVATDFSFQVNGGSATAFLQDGADPLAGKNTLTVDAGTYSVTEPAMAGYTTTYNNCSSVVVENGGTQTCTITNDDIAASLTVIKHVIIDNGGTATADNFTMNVTATNPSDDSFPGAEAPGTTITLDAGSYSVSETGPSGYTAAYSADCSGTIAVGESKTCTITNDDQPGTLIVKKVVITDNGGTATAEDFSFEVNGSAAIPFEADGQNDLTVDAGTYSVTEPAVAGYSTTYDNCTDVAVPNGGSATCTITNDDVSAHLTLVKLVSIDDGGTATAAEWTLSAAGPTPLSGAGGADGDVNAGTYTLSETGPAGYTAGAWSCVGGTQSGNQITLANGESATCTITNDDQPGTLIVKKVVVNDNGGTLEAEDFTFTVNGGSVIPFEADGQNDLTVDAGTYTVTEPPVSGYTTTYDNCTDIVVPNGSTATCTITNDDQSATLIVKKVVVNNSGGLLDVEDFSFQVNGGTATPFEADGQNDLTVNAGTYTVTEPAVSGYTTTYDNCTNLVIPNGGTATCTITNNDQPGTLIVQKIVVNDNGGMNVATDFSFSVNSGAATGFAQDGPDPLKGKNTLSVNAGTYSVTEPAVVGYSTSYDNCSDIVIPNGGTATCTITNDDNAPSLTLVKVVTNDNGGTATEADFTLSASGPTPISGAGAATSDAAFDAGTYDLSETSVTGYAASSWVCVGGTQDDADTVTIGLGESATCTITNDDIAPLLHLRKAIVNDNGGSATAADFTLTADGTGANDLSGTSPVDSGAGLKADTWALSETTLPGYTASAWSCVGGTQNGSNITLAIGQEATCTITNDDQQAYITVVKIVTNDNGGSAKPDDFKLTLEGNLVLSGVAVPVDPGTYTAGETLLSGYSFAGFSGDCNENGDITVALGESKTCTLTNDDQQAFITVVKVVTADNGGNAQPDDFKLTLEGDPVSSGVAVPVDPGTYTAAETLVPGYIFEGFSGACDSNGDITIALGESKTCTLTNNDIAPTLTLVKTVVNDDGGNAVVSDFPLFINGTAVISGMSTAVMANTLYTATETTQTGYTASVWGGDCAPDGTITLKEGENKTCTITNDDVAPTLKLVKNVVSDNGGNNVPNDWVLYAIASAPNDGRNFSNMGGSGVFETIYANVPYDLSESVVAGYTAGTWSCTDGTLVGSTLTLAEGQTGVTCTITNDDSAPTLTLVKIVVNDDGGDAVIADFPLFIDSTQVTSGVPTTLSANTLYTASETTQAGYTASAWSGNCNADGTITLAEGQNAVCTITNDDVAPTLKLVKNLITDNGGDAIADDWTLSAAAAAPNDGRNFSNPGGSGVFETVFANAGYDLSETTLPGYTAGSWSCDGGTLVGSTVTLAEGETVTCTITNDDVAPQLRIIKTVVNDDGGNAVVADFPLFIDGNSVTSGVFVEVTANAVHTATETSQPGYTASTWGGDCAADGTITLNEGDVKTCTITNNDVAPTLKLVKEVTNDNGGNAVADDWTLSAAAAAPLDGRNFSNMGGSGVFQTVFANAGYDLSETTLPGYTAGAWSCDGGTLVGSTVTLTEGVTGVTCTITNDDSAPTLTLIKNVITDNGGNAEPDDFSLTIGGSPATSGVAYTLSANTPYAIDETQLSGYTFVEITGDPECPAVLGGTVTLDEGENVTCTITNDDQPGTLIVRKEVINDHGGSLTATDFSFTVNDGTAIPFQQDGSDILKGMNVLTVDAGTYSVAEAGTPIPGYTTTYLAGQITHTCANLTIANGQTVTCTITNNDQPATLIIIKHVVNDNGGTADAADFTLDSGGTDDTPDNFAGEEAPGTTVTLDAGAYNVTETGPSGYSASFSADCAGTIANGETKTCTVTNDDIQPQLIVIKHVITDNGGTAVAGDFTMSVTGNNASPNSFAGAEAPGTNVALNAGAYSVGESGPSGYSASFSADCTGTIAVGETKTCTVTNDDISPTLTVIKDLLPGNDTGLFNLQIDGVTQAANVGDNGTTGAVAVNAGVVHTVGETAGTGTSLSDYVTTIGGDCAPDGTVSLALAENKTCTITNVRHGSIIIVKNTLGGDGTFDFTSGTLGNFSLTTSGGTASTTFSGLDPADTYDVAETVPTGWELNSATCDSGETVDSIDLDPGETVTCTFENEKAGSIVIVKNTVGGEGTFDFTSGTLGSFSLTTASNTASATFSNLDVDPTYDVAETVPSGWDLTGAACDSGETIDSIDLDPGETVTCTFTNTRRGHIIVDKVTLPSGDTQSFAFTTTGTGYNAFNLTDAAAPNDQELAPGTYTVTETALAGWDLTGLSCADPSGAPVLAGSKATINLAAGETVNCTFTNRKRGTITIVKDAVPNDAQDFAFTSTIPGAASFSLDDDSNVTLSNSKTVVNLIPGSYSVTEGAVAGWDLTGLTCNDANGTTNLGTRTANIALDAGENVTCTFTNTKRGTIIVEKQTSPDGLPGSFTFTGTAAGTISDNGTITVSNLVPGTYTSTESSFDTSLFTLASIVCNDGSSANPSTGSLTTRTATFNLDPGETVKCTFTNRKNFQGHPGTIGFWKNWRNHYTSAQAQLLINYLKSNNPKIYNKDLILNNSDDLTIAKWDAILNVGNKTTREQMLLAQFTALKLNLAITQLDGTGGLIQKNDDICLAGVVNVSGISGATAFFGTSTPTIQQVVNAVESKWTGKLTTNRSDWKWNLTNAQKDMLIKIVTGMNEGTLVMSSGCP